MTTQDALTSIYQSCKALILLNIRLKTTSRLPTTRKTSKIRHSYNRYRVNVVTTTQGTEHYTKINIYITLVPVNHYVEVQVNISRTFRRMITSFQRKINGLIGMGRAMNVRKRQRVAITAPIISLTNPGFVEPPSIRKRTTGTNLLSKQYKTTAETKL